MGQEGEVLLSVDRFLAFIVSGDQINLKNVEEVIHFVALTRIPPPAPPPQNAVTQGNMSLFGWINYTLQANNSNVTATNFQVKQLINASCACISVSNQTVNGTIYGTLAYQASDQTTECVGGGGTLAYQASDQTTESVGGGPHYQLHLTSHWLRYQHASKP